MKLPQVVTVLVPSLVAKLFPFILNTLVLSKTSITDLGKTAQIDLVISSILSLVRDPLRLVISSNKQQAINLSFISLLVFFVITPIALQFFVGISNYALLLFLAYSLELLAEPYLLISQYINLEFGRRATLESTSSILKGIAQAYCVLNYNNYILGYSVGQLVYSSVLLVGYVIFSRGQLLIPRYYTIKEKTEFVGSTTWSLYRSSFVQQIIKLFLSQGDKFVISSLLPLEDQGYYSLLDNYGSLVPRLIFAPLEEATRINVRSQLENKAPININSALLIYSHFLPILAIFGPLNINFLITILLRRELPVQVKQAFPLYILCLPFLAINGILEALNIVIFKHQANKQSMFMTFDAIIFYATMTLFVSYFNWGLPGFIFANIGNSFLRILWNGYSLRNILWSLKFKQPIFYYCTAPLSALVQYYLFGLQVTQPKHFFISFMCGISICGLCAFSLWDWRKKDNASYISEK